MIKLLFVPVSIIFAIFLSIFSIKPEIVNILAKRVELVKVKETLSKTQERNDNILAQMDSIGRKSSESEFADNYVQEKKVDDRTVHEISKLAIDSEVSLINVQPIARERRVETAPEVVVDPAALLADPSLAANLPKYIGESEIFGFDIQFAGEYSKIRNFVDKIFRESSMNVIETLEIVTEAKEDKPSDVLQGKMLVKYLYIPPVETASPFNYDAPIFDTREINFAAIEELQKTIKNDVPAMVSVSGEAGKDNPFSQ